MKISGLVPLLAAAVNLIPSVSAASSSNSSSSSAPHIEIKGNKFFYSNNGSQFYMRGIAYQEDSANASAGDTFNDPLADFDACKRDLPYFQKLRTNLLRVYAINTTLDHSQCMNLFADNGIYIIADLSEPGLSINRDSPAWNIDLYQRYTAVVDVMHNYSNVLGFFAGNEVTNNSTNTGASAFVKAAVRDVKAYIKDKKYRTIPVGYSTNDDADTRTDMASYFLCGDSDVSSDFYGVNMYEWCGDSDFKSSGFEARTKEFSNMSVPIFFSEYGCNLKRPRKFSEVSALYGNQMTDVWSGGIVYMYFQEANDYGLVKADGKSVSTLGDFSYLSKEMAKISPSTTKKDDVTPKSNKVQCPASTGDHWKANTSLPPVPSQGVCDCMYDSLSCVVADKVDSKKYGALFGIICGEVDCGGVTANGTSGKYGSYSFCSPKEQLSFLLDLYYKKNGSKSSACGFSGSATLAGKKTIEGSACSAALSQAGNSGLGAISVSVSATRSASNNGEYKKSGSGSSATGSSEASKSSSKSDANAVAPVSFTLTAMALGTVLVGTLLAL